MSTWPPDSGEDMIMRHAVTRRKDGLGAYKRQDEVISILRDDEKSDYATVARC